MLLHGECVFCRVQSIKSCILKQYGYNASHNNKEALMKTSTITEAKNNLSHLIRQLDVEEPVHLTRYGKSVAVMMSKTQYKKLISPVKSLNSAILNWRSQLDKIVNIGLRNEELKNIRKRICWARVFMGRINYLLDTNILSEPARKRQTSLRCNALPNMWGMETQHH